MPELRPLYYGFCYRLLEQPVYHANCRDAIENMMEILWQIAPKITHEDTKGPEYQEGSEARRKSTTAPKVERIEDRRCFKSSKGGLRGTYIAVEPFHLDRYLDEQMFR